jgi:hypothetical protein
MNKALKRIWTATFAVASLCLATLSIYILQIAWSAHQLLWEIDGAFCACVVLTAICLVPVSYGKRRLAVVRFTTLVIGCFAVGAIAYFGVLANCSLFCKNVVQAEYRSPSGQWKAIRFLRECRPPSGYCLPVSYVSILPSGAQLPGGVGDAIAIDAENGIRIDWKSEDTLMVSYPMGRVIHRPRQLGIVKIEYRPIVSM